MWDISIFLKSLARVITVKPDLVFIFLKLSQPSNIIRPHTLGDGSPREESDDRKILQDMRVLMPSLFHAQYFLPSCYRSLRIHTGITAYV